MNNHYAFHVPNPIEWDPRSLPYNLGGPGKMSKEKRLKAREKRKRLKKLNKRNRA